MPTSIYTYIAESDLVGLEKLIDSDVTCLNLRRGETRYTPLMSACWFLKIEIVQLLLKKGADIYAVNVWQGNVLHDVVGNIMVTPEMEYDKIEKLWVITKLLLEREAQLINEGYVPATRLIESKTDIGSTPFDMAVPKPEIHARLLRLVDEVADEFEKRDDSRLFFEPAAKPVTEKAGGFFSGFFHRHKQPPVKSEEETALVYREPISVGGVSKPKVE